MHEIIIFGNHDDQVATSLLKHLLEDGHSVSLVTAGELVTAQWKHTIDTSGRCKTEMILPNGNIIHSGKVKVVFNRIRFLQMFHFVNDTDRNYAEMEMFAIYISFLKSINHLLINPVKTNFLSLEEENELLLKKLAIDAGFCVVDYHFTSSPRWKHTQGLVPLNAEKKNISSSPKKSPNLVWENKPVVLKEAFDKSSRIIVVGNILLGKDADKYSDAVRKFSDFIATPFFELQMVRTREGDKLGTVNKFPVYGDSDVILSLASLVKLKLGNYS